MYISRIIKTVKEEQTDGQQRASINPERIQRKPHKLQSSAKPPVLIFQTKQNKTEHPEKM